MATASVPYRRDADTSVTRTQSLVVERQVVTRAIKARHVDTDTLTVGGRPWNPTLMLEETVRNHLRRELQAQHRLSTASSPPPPPPTPTLPAPPAAPASRLTACRSTTEVELEPCDSALGHSTWITRDTATGAQGAATLTTTGTMCVPALETASATLHRIQCSPHVPPQHVLMTTDTPGETSWQPWVSPAPALSSSTSSTSSTSSASSTSSDTDDTVKTLSDRTGVLEAILSDPPEAWTTRFVEWQAEPLTPSAAAASSQTPWIVVAASPHDNTTTATTTSRTVRAVNPAQQTWQFGGVSTQRLELGAGAHIALQPAVPNPDNNNVNSSKSIRALAVDGDGQAMWVHRPASWHDQADEAADEAADGVDRADQAAAAYSLVMAMGPSSSASAVLKSAAACHWLPQAHTLRVPSVQCTNNRQGWKTAEGETLVDYDAACRCVHLGPERMDSFAVGEGAWQGRHVAGAVGAPGHDVWALGAQALQQAGPEARNTVALGGHALRRVQLPRELTAIGSRSQAHLLDGLQCTSVGYASLYSNEHGCYNSAHGHSALKRATGSHLAALGCGALDELEQGDGNTAVGSGAGHHLVRGDNNTFVGAHAGPAAQYLSRTLCLGSGARAQRDGDLALGSTQAPLTVTSRASNGDCSMLSPQQYLSIVLNGQRYKLALYKE